MAWMKWRGSKASGRYYAIWNEVVAGKRKKRFRALTRDAKTSQKALAELEANLALRGVGMAQVVGLGQLKADYLKLLKADNCTESYISRVRIILGHLERLYKGIKLPAVTADLLDDYKVKRREEGVQGSTINREVTAIKAAIRKGRRWQYQIQDLSDVSRVKVDEKVKRGFSPAEVKTMMAAAAEIPALLTVLWLGLYAGLRRGEMLQLRVRDVDFTTDTITLGDGWRVKMGKSRAVPLNPALKTYLEGILAGLERDAAVLTWPGTPEALTHAFTAFRERLGIDRGSIHRLRHTFISELKRRNVDTGKTMRMVGHTTERTTQGYTHLDVTDLREGIGRLAYE